MKFWLIGGAVYLAVVVICWKANDDHKEPI